MTTEKQRKHEYYLKNKNEIKKKRRDYYLKNKIKINEYNKNWNTRNINRYRASVRKSERKIRLNLKLQIFSILGGKCSNPNCAVIGGMTDIRALQIDHVNGHGNQERKQLNAKHNNIKYYRYVLTKIQVGSKDYQLLCANCNWIKRFENRETNHI